MIPALFAGLVDDAALFPPGDVPLEEAVPLHREHHASWYGGLVGAFVCPDTRVAELTGPMDVSLILTGALLPRLPDGVTLAAVETRGKVPEIGVPVYVEGGEIPAGCRGKLRTGGTTASAFPSEAEVADYVAHRVDEKVGFKCTAGLHHAVRHTAADTGFEHHGFLNVLAAVDAALRGAEVGDLVAILAERDEQSVVERVRGIDDPAAVRRAFASFGSCSITEPVDDLVRLGLLVPGGAG